MHLVAQPVSSSYIFSWRSLQCFQRFSQDPDGFLFPNKVLQRLVVDADVLHALCDELMCSEARGEACQPARRRFVFLGDALAQACNIAARIV